MSEHTAPRRKLAQWASLGASLTLTFTFALLAACGGGLVPVHNIQNAPVVVAHGQAATTPQVRDAIVRALGSRNWQLNREGPEGIVATMISGGHWGTIRIQYDEHTYSIQYVDSSPGLRFNDQTNAIHRTYNGWVDKLNRSIRSLLMGPHWGGVQVVIPPPPPSTPPPPAEPAPAVAPPPNTAGPTYDDAPPPPPPPPPAAPHP